MKKFISVILCSLLILSFAGCTAKKDSSVAGFTVTDSFGNTAVLNKDSRIVSCYASFTQMILLAGGDVMGITGDCITERGMSFGEDVLVIGTTKSVNTETLVSLNPDYVILSADISSQKSLENTLRDMGIQYGYFRMDSFDDYKNMMVQFTEVFGRNDLYEKNVSSAEEKIISVLGKIPEETDISALLIRAYSTGMKAKRDDNLAGQILTEFGIKNIADKYPSLLEEISMEEVIASDPDYIFVLSMGDEKAAEEYLRQNVENNPLWQGLSAVKNGRYEILPKELFHYKPNEKWGESYEYLAKILFPEIFTEE